MAPWVLCVSALLVRVEHLLGTDALEPIGVSTQARMRGGADVAVGDSALSQIDNPATLSLQPRGLTSFDLASQVAYVDGPWHNAIDEADSQCKLIHLHNFGLAFPYDEKLTFGLAVHSKAGLGTRFKIRHLMIPHMKRRVGSDMKNLSFLPSVAYKVTDKLSLGIGGRFELASSEFSMVLGPADLEFGRGYAYGGGFQAGMHYQAREDLAFGLAYRSPSWFGDLSGGDARASLFGLLPIKLGGAHLSDVQLPQKVTAGVAWDATERLKLIGEARWINYENSTFHSTVVGIDSVMDIRYPLPLGFRDQWVFIVGAEYKLDEHWVVAGGYHYATAAVPSENMLPICSIVAQQHATLGLRYETEKWWAGVGYIVAFKESLNGPGYSRIPFGIDYGFGEMAQTQHSISFGFGFRW
jgi:long-chain fatty acid transport protein